jgi:hypothetical protein
MSYGISYALYLFKWIWLVDHTDLCVISEYGGIGMCTPLAQTGEYFIWSFARLAFAVCILEIIHV